MDEKDFFRFIRSMREFNNESTDVQRDYEKRQAEAKGVKLSFGYPKLSFMSMPNLVDIICYCLIPNHYHFLVKQLVKEGILKFMKRISGGYTNCFNKKYDCSGSLFQGTYKAIQIKTDNYLEYLSGYINGNAEIHKITKTVDWPWSSYKDYAGLRKGTL
ncbi:MAG: transposase [Patescibacteria group bacterium]